MSGRFRDRPKRLARRTEREKFERSVMPAAYICLPVAVAVFIAAALSYLIYGEFPRDILVLGVAIVAIPVVLIVYRFLRGHFSKSLHEP
jgi:drug/metabolite transporter (DMT)-like permease